MLKMAPNVAPLEVLWMGFSAGFSTIPGMISTKSSRFRAFLDRLFQWILWFITRWILWFITRWILWFMDVYARSICSSWWLLDLPCHQKLENPWSKLDDEDGGTLLLVKAEWAIQTVRSRIISPFQINPCFTLQPSGINPFLLPCPFCLGIHHQSPITSLSFWRLKPIMDVS